MKKGFVAIALLFSVCLTVYSAPFKFLKTVVNLPDNSQLELFASGDEFYNWLHDGEGYTVLQAADGYYYYAEQGENGELVASTLRYGESDPSGEGIPKWLKIPKERYDRKKSTMLKSSEIVNAPREGVLNNVVIYIRFNDDEEFTISRGEYDSKFNSSEEYSLRGYYQEVSYGNLDIVSTHFPESSSDVNASYKDGHNRGYFQAYNETTAPGGFKNDDERTQREHVLLRDAINSLRDKIEEKFTAEELDADSDGKVDNVCFVVRGQSEGWSSLLWAHRWSLFSLDVRLHGKRVYDYVFQPENQVVAKTLCHEMFHALGAPDLYHYEDNGISPAGGWDLMESGKGHMLAYMKWKYAGQKWISEIPEITSPGRYSLKPLASAENNCYMIKSSNSEDEYYVLEYRKKDENTYDRFVPGSGLIVYRVNPKLNGNADGPPDEVYVYRPNGNLSYNGDVSKAYFSLEADRTSFHNTTDPIPFLSDGSNGGLILSDISSAGDEIQFSYGFIEVKPLEKFWGTGINESTVQLDWKMNKENNFVVVAYSEDGVFGAPVENVSYNVGDEIPGGGTVVVASNFLTSFEHSDLDANKAYYYAAWSFDGEKYSESKKCRISTNCSCLNKESYLMDFEGGIDLEEACWRFKRNSSEDGGLSGENLVEISSEDDDTWFIGDATGGPNGEDMVYEGDAALMIRSSASAFNWAISPEFKVGNGGAEPQLNFMVHYQNDVSEGGYRYSNFFVLIENEGEWEVLLDWSDNKDPSVIENPSNLYESEVEVDLVPYMGKKVKIAFVYQQSNGYPVALDNIVFKDINSMDVVLGMAQLNGGDSGMQIFPNPVKEKLMLHFLNSKERIVKIYNRFGGLMCLQKSQAERVSINTANYSSGMYIIEVLSLDEVVKRKFIKL